MLAVVFAFWTVGLACAPFHEPAVNTDVNGVHGNILNQLPGELSREFHPADFRGLGEPYADEKAVEVASMV